jgi:NADPH:quinone reductase-like Zn-dependent oxidoreductase
VLGATGNAGRMAVEIAKQLGAAEVIGAGRDAGRRAGLADLGADVAVPLEADALGEAAADVDIVLDYLWGAPAEHAMVAIARRRRDRSRRLDWIQIGSVAGPDVSLPSALLRAADFRVMGSGQGSVSTAAIVEELPALAARIPSLRVDAAAVPLRDVEAVWSAPADGRRVVLTP